MIGLLCALRILNLKNSRRISLVQIASRLSTHCEIFFAARFATRGKFIFAKRVGRNFNAIRQFARDDEESSTRFPEVWLKPL